VRVEPRLELGLRRVLRVVAGPRGLRLDGQERGVVREAIPRAVHDVEVGAGGVRSRTPGPRELIAQGAVPGPHLVEEDVVEDVGRLDERLHGLPVGLVEERGVEGDLGGRELLDTSLELRRIDARRERDVTGLRGRAVVGGVRRGAGGERNGQRHRERHRAPRDAREWSSWRHRSRPSIGIEACA
jgi:hypothetical protein